MSSIPLATSVRSLNRLRQIATVLAGHGFGHIVQRLDLRRYLPLGRLLRSEPSTVMPPARVTLGRRLTAVCADLGPTFVKLGQMLSTRPDLLPADVVTELRSLQDRVPPFDTDEAIGLITRQIGADLDACFERFDRTPAASGSIAQVHHARTKSGEDVVVKIKRPGIDDTVRNDIHILRWLAQMMDRLIPELARYRPTMIVDEFDQMLRRELDFISEASATARFSQALVDMPYVTVPSVHWDLTAPGVLTLSLVRGESIEQILADSDGSVNRALLARRLVQLYMAQFFDMGLFHADPHPGNILVTAPARIGLIDFGEVGTLSDELTGQLVAMVVAAVYREPQVIVDTLTDLGAAGPETDTRALARALRNLLDKYYGLPLKRLDLVTIFGEITEVIRSQNVTLPRDLVAVLKTLVTISGVALKLDPELNLVEVMGPRVRRLITDRLSPRRLFRVTGVALWHTLSILKSAPGQLRSVLRRISLGTWQINIRHENLERLTAELDRASNRLSFSVIIAAVIVGSSMVITAGGESQLFGIPLRWIGIAGYLFAGMLGVGLVWAILRSGRLS